MIPDSSCSEAKIRYFVGLMSGTSLDGVDAALVDFSAAEPRLIATHYLPYPQELTIRLLDLQCSGENELHRAAQLGNDLARLYHESVEALLLKSGMSNRAIAAIGCHGQTVRHNPQAGYTLQIGNPFLLAELSGIDVVADFRGGDVSAGGQGAPLVPAFHDAAFRISDKHRLILNIGGIANLTDLRPEKATSGFDCGPGNMLLDAWIRKHRGQPYDNDGVWATSGRLIPDLLQTLLAHPYFELDPPKSCGREEFNLAWLAPLAVRFPAEDVQATLLALSVESCSLAIERWCGHPDEVVICGGGANNSALMRGLRERLGLARVVKSDRIGIGADWVEAVAFAWLARQRLLGRHGNLPEVTGARRLRQLGAIYPA